MSAIERVLFPAPTLVRSPLHLMRWWESRRVTYNLVVGAAGALTVGAFGLLTLLPGVFHGQRVPWLVIPAYGLMANVCYSSGWIIESLLQRWLRRDTYGLGPALFRHGLVFSVGLTLFPAGMAWLAWVVTHIVR
ncbi:MAG TPA: hypothetical protein VG818_04975 [Gemmatimonadaceae bacterium]|nr:hypothetical protein [Gemmatimonadaceae bacterium]